MLTQIFAPLLGLSLTISGTTFFSSYIALRMNLEQESDFLIGLVYSAQSAGFLLGALYIERLLKKIGHIRSFSFFSASLVFFILIHVLLYHPFLWIFWRFCIGVAIAAIYVVIESWLLILSDSNSRGKVLAALMVALYGSQTISQLFIQTSNLKAVEPFIFAALFCSIAIMPVILKKVDCPMTEHESLPTFLEIYRLSPVAVVSCFLSGLLNAPIYSLLPVFGQNIGMSLMEISYLMASVLLGGVMLQWPIGKYSEKSNRTKVLLFINLMILLVSLTIFLTPSEYLKYFIYVLIFIFGGGVFSIYPLSISIAADYSDAKHLVGLVGFMLIIYSLGSIAGPILASLFMESVRTGGVFIFNSLSCFLWILYAFYRRTQREPMPAEEQGAVLLTPPTSLTVGELDPNI